jgi:hypothetical protein
MRHDAILNVHSNVTHIFGDNEAYDVDNNLVELDEEKVHTETNRLQAEFDAQAYARDRKAEYDALNQFEMQYDDKEDGTTTWEDAIAAIKTKYPKG